MEGQQVSRFLSRLTESLSFSHVFNPWKDADRENDLGSHCAGIRRQQLSHYLQFRLGKAQYLLIGEAVGYQGGHFSGIPMTSERILLGFQVKKGIHPAGVLPGLDPQRTSRPDRMPLGFSEPTATIVWETLLKSGLQADEFVLWNAFAWHPYDPGKGLLSNRKPRVGEMEAGLHVLAEFMGLFPGKTVVAIGKVAQEWLRRLNIEGHPLRHPAQGGSRAFRTGWSELLVKRREQMNEGFDPR